MHRLSWSRSAISTFISPSAASVSCRLVARVTPGYTLALNRFEVAEAFEVPLAFLMEPHNHERHSRDWNGITRHYYAIPYLERYIWGVTAGILRNLYERICRE